MVVGMSYAPPKYKQGGPVPMEYLKERFPIFEIPDAELLRWGKSLYKWLARFGKIYVTAQAAERIVTDEYCMQKTINALLRYVVWFRVFKKKDASTPTVLAVLAYWVARCRPLALVSKNPKDHFALCNIQIALGLVKESICLRLKDGTWVMTPEIRDEIKEMLTFRNVTEEVFRMYVARLT